MATPTVNHSRAHALVPRIARLDAEPARLEAVALGLVDALLEGDDETLPLPFTPSATPARGPMAIGAGRVAGRGDRLRALGTRARAIAGRRGPGNAGPRLPARSTARRSGSAELRRLLEIDETQVSRTGRRLLESGLVTRRKVGRQVFWQLTPRGQRALEERRQPAAITQLGVLAGGPPTRL